MRQIILLSLLALAACGPKAAEPAAVPAAAAVAPAVADFSQDIDAHGTEPFWAVKVRGTTLTLSRPSLPDLVAQAPGAVIRPGQGGWTAKTTDGQTLAMTLYLSPCSDGMSDLSYPMSAEVEIAGQRLQGCASKTAEKPREGG